MRGRDIKRYGYNFADLWIIATFPSRNYDINKYPAVKKHLLSFGMERLEQTGKSYIIDGKEVKARKKTNNKWFETQDSIGYWEDFNKQKIVYPNMTKFLPFYFDSNFYLLNQKCFFIIGEQLGWLCAFLNSNLFKMCFIDNFPTLGEDRRELSKIFFEQIHIPCLTNKLNSEFEELVLKNQNNYNNILNKSIEDKVNSIFNLTEKEKNILSKCNII